MTAIRLIIGLILIMVSFWLFATMQGSPNWALAGAIGAAGIILIGSIFFTKK